MLHPLRNKLKLDMDCDIYSLPLFSGGNKELIDNILQENPARHRLYAKGDIIALQGYVCKQLYLLCSGSAYARMVSEEGREFTLDTLSAPEVLASSFIFSTDGIFPVTIIAASDCSIWLISREAMLRILKADQTVMQNYLRVISDHSMFLSNRLVEFALQTLSSRIVSYIENNGPISNLQETAFILGVTRPSLSRAVSQLVSQGTLRKTTDGYVLTAAS